jgi:hypothetical protein
MRRLWVVKNSVTGCKSVIFRDVDRVLAPHRQQVYLRVVETIPGLSIHYGHYLSHVIRMPLANSPRLPAPSEPARDRVSS